MPLSIVYTPTACKQLSKLDRASANRVLDGLEYFAEHRRPRPKPLRGEYQGSFRLRFESFRAIVNIDETEQLLQILAVGDRKDIY